MARISGVTYYKLEDRYTGDVTKGCSLIGKEIDNNFHFLRGEDVSNAYIDEEIGSLIIELVNGEKIVVENLGNYISSLSTEFSAATYDKEYGILTILSGNKEYSISGFTTQTDIFSYTDGIDIKGDGTAENPIRINTAERTGMYAPVMTAETEEEFVIGGRYLLRKLVEPCSGQPLEWRYFIYDYDETSQEWVNTELKPGESTTVVNYKNLKYVDVVCKLGNEGSILEVKNKPIIGLNAIKVDEKELSKEIWIKIPSNEKVLSQSESGISTTLHLKYKNENGMPKIYLLGKSNSISNAIDYVELTDIKNLSGWVKEEMFLFSGATAQNFADVYGTISSLKNETVVEISEIKTFISQITADTASSIERLYNTISDLSGNTERNISQLSQDLQTLGNEAENKFRKIENTISDLSGNTSNKINTLSGNTARELANIHSDINEINNSLSDIENDLSELSGSTIRNFSELSAGTLNKINALSGNTVRELASIHSDIETINVELSETANSLSELSGATTRNISQLSNEIETLGEDVTNRFRDMESAISEFSGTTANEINALSGSTVRELASIRSYIEIVNGELTTAINDLNEKVDYLYRVVENDIQEVNNRVTSLSSATKVNLEQLQDNIDSLAECTNTKFENVYIRLNEIEGDVEDKYNILNDRITLLSSSTSTNIALIREEVEQFANEFNISLHQLSGSVIELSAETVSLESCSTITARTYNDAIAIENLKLGRIIYVLNSWTDPETGIKYSSGAYIKTQSSGLKKIDVTTPSTSQTLDERVEELENEYGQLRTDVNSLSAKTSSIDSAITSINEDITSIQTEISDLSGVTKTVVDELSDELSSIDSKYSSITQHLQEEIENLQNDGLITRDISYIGKDGQIHIIYSGTSVTDAIDDVANNVGGGGGDGKVKNVKVNSISVLDEETGIADIIIEGDSDIDVSSGASGEAIISLKGISNGTVVLQ